MKGAELSFYKKTHIAMQQQENIMHILTAKTVSQYFTPAKSGGQNRTPRIPCNILIFRACLLIADIGRFSLSENRMKHDLRFFVFMHEIAAFWQFVPQKTVHILRFPP